MLVTGVLWWAWGDAAIVPGLVFGGVATLIQAAALKAMRGATKLPPMALAARWGLGITLRFGGVVLFAVAVLVDRERFPPLPAAFGYLGVLLPLLVLEQRMAR